MFSSNIYQNSLSILIHVPLFLCLYTDCQFTEKQIRVVLTQNPNKELHLSLISGNPKETVLSAINQCQNVIQNGNGFSFNQNNLLYQYLDSGDLHHRLKDPFDLKSSFQTFLPSLFHRSAQRPSFVHSASPL